MFCDDTPVWQHYTETIGHGVLNIFINNVVPQILISL